jgi:hypothetical protein
MAGIAKQVKSYPNPADSNKMTEFYLAHQNGMDRAKQYVHTVKVNGYEFTAEFGKENILPTDVVRVLQDSKSAVHPTKNVGLIDSAIGGTGRSSKDVMQKYQETQYIPDFDVVIRKEV